MSDNGTKMNQYAWMAYDVGNCDLFPDTQVIEARDIKHALQRIAAALPDEEPDHLYVALMHEKGNGLPRWRKKNV
jgi:hypothetical protein